MSDAKTDGDVIAPDASTIHDLDFDIPNMLDFLQDYRLALAQWVQIPYCVTEEQVKIVYDTLITQRNYVFSDWDLLLFAHVHNCRIMRVSEDDGAPARIHVFAKKTVNAGATTVTYLQRKDSVHYNITDIVNAATDTDATLQDALLERLQRTEQFDILSHMDVMFDSCIVTEEP